MNATPPSEPTVVDVQTNEQPKKPLFEVGQQVVLKNVLFKVRKITNKDLVLRPIGMLPPST